MALTNVTVGTSNTDLIAPTVETMVLGVTFCNYSASAVTIQVYAVANGNTIGNSSIILKDLTIPAGDTFQLDMDERMLLANGDRLVASASAASSVTATVIWRTV